MLNWKITATQDEDSWFDDYVRAYIGSDLPHLPPHVANIGAVEATWVETQPGFFAVEVTGGTRNDRWFADTYLDSILKLHGLERQKFVFDHEHKTADYSDVEQKAVRLIQSGKVHVMANHDDAIFGIVEGDHGTYEVEIWKDAPNANGEPSESISRWNCECEWGQFAWGRTRQWKRFEGRPCAHCLALYWAARSVPQEMEQIPEGWAEQPATGEYPGTGGMVPPGASPMLTNPPMVPPPVAEQAAPGQGAPGQAPTPPATLPPYPAAPENMPVINPVSVPGQKPQSPVNPVQNAGGTFSHIAKQEYNEGDMVQLKDTEPNGIWQGLGGGGSGIIPKNSIGQVEGTHPTTGLVEVYYPGPASKHGPNEPHGITAWHWPEDLIPRPDIPPYGSATTRRR